MGGALVTAAALALAGPALARLPALAGALLGLCLCALGLCGDLLVSAIKRDAGVKDAELMGNSINDASSVCKQDLQCSYKPNHGAGVGIDFNDFVGLPAVGTWKFCAGDRLKFDTGFIDAQRETIAAAGVTLAQLESPIEAVTAALRHALAGGHHGLAGFSAVWTQAADECDQRCQHGHDDHRHDDEQGTAAA